MVYEGDSPMILDRDKRFLISETGDSLHEAFDHKMTVHAMPRGESVRPAELPGLWTGAMSGTFPRDGCWGGE